MEVFPMKRIKHCHILKLAAMLLAALCLVSCGGEGKAKSGESAYGGITEQVAAQTMSLTSAVNGDIKQSLTLTGYLDPNLPEYSFIKNAVNLYMKEHPGVAITLDNRADSPDYYNYIAEFPALMESGQAGDIVMPPSGFTSGRKASGYYMDLYPLMESDPLFNPDGYFMNIVDANASGGKLYGLYTAFAIPNIFMLRNDISDELSGAFLSEDCVTYNDAVSLFINNYNSDNKNVRYFTSLFQPMAFLEQNYDSLIDFDKKEARFTEPEFINLIKKVREMPINTDGIRYYPDNYTLSLKYHDWLTPFSDGHIPEPLRDKGMLVNLTPFETKTAVAALYPSPKRLYTEPRVLATAGGNHTFAANSVFAISKDCHNSELAWDFIKFMLEEVDYTGNYYPVNKNGFIRYLDAQAAELFELIKSTEYATDVGFEEYKSLVQDFFTQAAERCNSVEGAYSPDVNIWEELYLYLTDSQSAETAMANIQKKVEVWLND
jgi:ABC-type glycerol-3-phosphate transport system substrate-binding protein